MKIDFDQQELRVLYDIATKYDLPSVVTDWTEDLLEDYLEAAYDYEVIYGFEPGDEYEPNANGRIAGRIADKIASLQ